jgi:hypothetical protein
MRVLHLRPLNVTVTVCWLALMLMATAGLPDRNELVGYLLLACPMYIVGLGVWRTIGAGAKIDELPGVLGEQPLVS